MFFIASILSYFLYAVGAFLLLNCLYLLFFTIAGHRQRRSLLPNNTTGEINKLHNICVLIPAYKADAVILDTAINASNHQYDGAFQVVVIADGLLLGTIQLLKNNSIQTIEVAFDRSTKGKAMLQALSILPHQTYEIAVVLDADNIMGKDCLNSINNAYNSGYKVIQTHRTALNKDTAFALLDSCNEEINNHIYRKGPFALGLSSALIGSGMAFNYEYLKSILVGIGETVGEDKEMDFRIARDKVKVCYLDNVYVYDEKIDNAQVFTQQRTRWLASQIEFLKKYAGEGVIQLVKFKNVEFFNKAVQTFLVPRTLLIGILGLFCLQAFLLPVGPSFSFWTGLLLLLGATLLMALPARLYNWHLLSAIVRLPYAIFCMSVALFRINRTKNSFLATPHKTRIHSPDFE